MTPTKSALRAEVETLTAWIARYVGDGEPRQCHVDSEDLGRMGSHLARLSAEVASANVMLGQLAETNTELRQELAKVERLTAQLATARADERERCARYIQGKYGEKGIAAAIRSLT